jgi:hypothetical protein
MTRPGLFVLTTLCALGLSGLLTASAAEDAPAGVVIAGRVPLPLIEPARGERCVAETAYMRRNHMKLLSHQRDDTVHLGERTAAFSLKACIDCHASASTGSVAASASNFCQSCHAYAAVKLDCFECHSSKPADEGGVSPHGATPAATMQPARLP